MKVRNRSFKPTDGIHDVIEESANFYVCQILNGQPYALPKENYEPVPEEQWEDVTAECETQDLYSSDGHMQEVFHRNGFVTRPISGYRFRRVNIFGPARVECALIIEKKKA